MKNNRILLMALLLGVLLCPAWSQGQEDEAEKLLALRAARIDAMRQLAEIIQGLRIGPNRQVKDFLAEHEELPIFLIAFLQDTQMVSEPQYLADGTCRLSMEVNLNEVIFGLQEAWRYRPSQMISSADQFEKIRHYTRERFFKATGTGVVRGSNRADFRPKRVVDVQRPVPQALDPNNIWNNIDPQGKLLALRAAQVDAYRNLGETIKGIQVSSTTTVRDFIAESDEIRTAFNAFIRGIEMAEEPKYRPDGVVEVTVQISLEMVIEALAAISETAKNNGRWESQVFQKIRQAYAHKTIRVKGTGIPAPRYIAQMPAKQQLPIPAIVVGIPEWAKRTLRVKGVGAFPDSREDATKAEVIARRVAKLNGYQQLEGYILGYKLDAATSVFDFIQTNAKLEAVFKELVKKARVRSYKTLGNKTVEVELELHLGEIWQFIQANK